MEDLPCFSRSLEILDRLTDDLRCSKCSMLNSDLFTMGVCEHMLCSECAEGNLGCDCPVCGLPTHVKDAQLNRELSNMVKLCQELRGLLTSEETGDVEVGGPNLTMLTPDGQSGHQTSVFDFVGTPIDTRTREQETEKPESRITGRDRVSKRRNSSIKRLQPKSTRSKISHKAPSNLVQTTMTQLFDDVLISPKTEPKTPKSDKTAISEKKSRTLFTPKAVTPKQTKGNNSCAKGRQLSATPQQVESPVSPKTPVSGKKRQIDPHQRRNAKGETILHVAVIKGDVERVQALLSEGASPNTRDHAGWTPLHEACNHGFTEIAELLLNNGALINTPGMENDSPLHDAVSNNRVDCVKLLVSRGASQTTRNIHGQTVRDLAFSEEMKAALETEVMSMENTSQMVTSVPRSFEPVVLLGTALSRDQRIQLHKLTGVIQARVVEEFSPEVTHVVTSCNSNGQCPRTLKYLRAILTGKWVVSLDWVKTCLEYGDHVAEEVFEVTGSTPNPDTHAPNKGRLNETQQLPRLFDGCKFYFSGTFVHPTPDVTELIQLVRCGGGTVLSREPKLHILDDFELTVPYHTLPDSSLANCGIFMVYDNRAEYQPIRKSRICTVTVSWLMDSIASFELLDLPDVAV